MPLAFLAHGATVITEPFGQHDHDVLVCGGYLFEQGDLLGGHVEGVAVEAFGFRGFRQAQEHEDNVGVLGGFHGFGFEGRVGRFQIEREAGGEVGLDAALGERVEEAGHLGGGDVGGAAAWACANAYSFVFVIFTAPPLPKNKGGTSEPDVPPEMKSHVLQSSA